jgi:hypothetical protein
MLIKDRHQTVRSTELLNLTKQYSESQRNTTLARSHSDSLKLLQASLLIPQHHLPVPFLLNLMLQYDVEVKIVFAALNIDAEGNSWLKVNLTGSNRELVRVLNYLSSLKILCKIDRDRSFR